jgi:DNA end-binding protein Ku
MSTMRFADEVVDATDLDEIPTPGPEPAKKELTLATQIIDALATDWDPERYHDTFTEQLRSLIEAKGRGEEIALEEAPETQAKVLDLLSALEASVADARSARESSRSTSTRSRSTSARRRGSTTTVTPKKAAKKAPTKKAPTKKAPTRGRSQVAS